MTTANSNSDLTPSCNTGAGSLHHPARSLWNPFLVGALIGVLSWAVFVIVDKPIGMSTAVSEIAGAVAIPVVGREAVESNTYWSRHSPSINYGLLFLVGTFLGALISSVISGRFRLEVVPHVWQERFGGKPVARLSVAFIGGILTMYGARLAGGCTSGHGISQTLQLAVVGWVFFVSLFVSGLITAWLVFRKPGTAA
jgi:uncharacterized protein